MEMESEKNNKEHAEKIYTGNDTKKEMMETETDEDETEDTMNGSSHNETKTEQKEIKTLQLSLLQNPYDYASHIALINKLQQMNEPDLLRDARKNMNAIYPLNPELWMSWIHDEIEAATTFEQKLQLVKLCQKAVTDYLSAEVWLQYLRLSIETTNKKEENEVQELRNIFESAVAAVGKHTIKGAIVWEAFREFEILLFKAMDADHTKKRQQLNRIGSLFQRQLTCSLLDMEKTYEEYQSWRAGDGAEAIIDDNVVSKEYGSAFTKLTSRLPYEEKLVSSQGESELLDAYKAYLLYEKRGGDPLRITVLYERAIVELSLEISIWLDYINYLGKSGQDETLDTVYQRATRNIPWCSLVWQKWIRSYERWNKPLTTIQDILENAFAIGFSTAEDYRNIWIMYLECLRRKLDQDSEKRDTYLEITFKAFNKACEQLAKYFGLDGDPACVILQYWARIEAIYGKNMDKSRALWSDILSQGHSATASYWLEYITLEKCYGDNKHLRKLYRKALAAVKDWPESIANSWTDFERDSGTLEQMEFCEVRVKERLNEIAEERQQMQSSAYSDVVDNKKSNKRKPDDNASGKWKNLGGSPSKLLKTDAPMKLKLRESRLNIKDKTDTNKEKFKEDKDMDIDDQHEINNDISVFISNLDYSATEEEIRDALRSAGPITLFKMIKDYKGRSKGYCYVQLSDARSVNEALKLDRTSIKGRPMFVSRCNPDKNSRSSGFKYNPVLEKNKLFVKGLPVTMTKEELEKIFVVYGPLKEVRLVTYRNGHSKGLAYVEYQNETAAAKALLHTDEMKIQDKVISVAISQPPERKRSQITEDITQTRLFGRATSSRSGPKTVLSMVPRNVKTSANGCNYSTENNTKQPMSNQDFRNIFLSKS